MDSETKFKQQVRAGAASLAALLFGTAGWLPLVIAAGLAMGDASRSKIVIGLALAGAAALFGLVLSGLALVRARQAGIEIVAAIGGAAGAMLGVLVVVFALSFHW
jgi:hypothetical protein